jgi:hypothetical protein
MPYKHDIFISYRRDEETRAWLNKHFIPLLKHRLKMELGIEPSIYTDQQLEIGSSWPVALGDEIASSKILIALWTKTYLNSEWCACELSHMLEREIRYGLRQAQNMDGLVVPIIVHDGETLPAPLSIGQKLEIQDCFNSRMSIDSPKAEKLAENLSTAASGIAKLIVNAPGWEEQWNIIAKNNFFQLYYKNENPQQKELPKFTTK